ncbi:MAG: maltokinase N-terminal cap-like domain-containing protein [Acidimicrobiales bacterium]
MALYHVATVTPTKDEMITSWLPAQPWGPGPDVPLEVIGAFRFDDPAHEVGLETFLVAAGDAFYQVPFTYRGAPLEREGAVLVSTTEHTVLGTRWVYDGLTDPTYLTMLAAVTMTGQGEALGMAEFDGRWYVAPAPVRISGGGWGQERVPLDGFEVVDGTAQAEVVVLCNDAFEIQTWRRPAVGEAGSMRLTATWDGQPEPVVLAQVSELA